ncbi:MAG: hypothetical protein WCX61_01585 [Candidatus Peribacteraceae bacterium]|jgi:hypothetical protein
MTDILPNEEPPLTEDIEHNLAVSLQELLRQHAIILQECGHPYHAHATGNQARTFAVLCPEHRPLACGIYSRILKNPAEHDALMTELSVLLRGELQALLETSFPAISENRRQHVREQAQAGITAVHTPELCAAVIGTILENSNADGAEGIRINTLAIGVAQERQLT